MKVAMQLQSSLPRPLYEASSSMCANRHHGMLSTCSLTYLAG